jgi:NAD(P)-dependent dehydrogenase (short-subunit alcohol dehydrogenase family)
MMGLRWALQSIMKSPPETQVVIVTGASSGIGEATVRRLVRGGARAVLFARRAERLVALAREIDPARNHTLAVAGDITADADRRRLVAETLARFGRIDALVNNAGYGQRGPLELVPLDAIRRNFETNVFSLVALTQLVAPVLRAQGGGRIVNIGSVAGRVTRPLSATYDSTKFALEGITDGLRGELKPFGIRVILVRPGFIRTEFGDVARGVSADTLPQTGPYGPFAGAFASGARKLRRVAGEPGDIARLVDKALRSAYPKTHYNGPAHARLFLFLKWLLPVRAMDWALRLRRS